jgi:hypothetical protein
LKTLKSLIADTDFEVEIAGSQDVKSAVVFVHGFGVRLDINDISRLVRSDLVNDVPSEFWTEFQLIDADYLYRKLSKNNDLIIVFAGNDQILGVQTPPWDIQAFTITDADHDFSSTSRSSLLNLLNEMFERL